MKKILALLLMVAATLSSCIKQDLDEIRSRLSSLEEWQASMNSDIASLKSLITALEAKDFVTGVTPLSDGTGYVITFVNSGAVTIKHGEKGSTPIMGTKQHTDGKYYWTVNGEWLLNADAKVLVTGEAPQVRINSTSGMWEISTDGGANYYSTGVKAQGDAIFAANDVDNTNADYVILTLADGTTKIQLLKYKVFRIGNDGSSDAISITSIGSVIIPLSLPAGFKEADYTAIMAEVKSNKGVGTDIKTRAATSPWTVTVQKPTFEADGACNNDATVTINVLAGIAVDETALLEVTLVGGEGGKTVTSRVLEFAVNILTHNAKGSGTQATPYLIYNSVQLADLAAEVNDGTDMSGVYFKQMSDITLIDFVNWTPIGNDETKPFKGNFDGGGKTISGFSIPTTIVGANFSTDQRFAGLFGYVNGGSIKNLNVTGSIIQGSPTNIDGVPKIEIGQIHIGGIIGYLKSGSVENLSATVTIFGRQDGASAMAADNTYIGGAIGKSDVVLGRGVFKVNSTISFVGGSGALIYCGHNVGWCIDGTKTKSANSGYGSYDPAIIITGSNRIEMINGY